nr:MAG TPA: hypothetical protein [Caudoviricetes sp.]
MGRVIRVRLLTSCNLLDERRAALVSLIGQGREEVSRFCRESKVGDS